MATKVGPGWRALLLVEYVVVFVGLPLYLARGPLPFPLFPALWVFAAVCLGALLASRRFERRRLWNPERLRHRVVLALAPFAVAAPLIALWTALAEPELFFRFVRQRPGLWAAVMLLYPVLSAYPQGLIYRAFIFHRYEPLFRRRWARILASGLAFALAHVLFRNWTAPLLGLAGGVLFAWTYERTRSSLVATIQHAAFGCWLFTTGLGWYFYHGAVRFDP